jgi:pyridoxal phosphate-dependent aminotransferase EpsN
MSGLTRNPEKIFLSCSHMGGGEQRFIQSAFDQNWVAPSGENIDRFEEELARKCGAVACAAVSSGTAALHLALILAGVKRDDFVLCQSFTFSASANPIVYQGAIPVFVGSESDTWNMCPESLELALKTLIARGKRPKAVIVVHLYGTPAKLNEILEVCTRYDVTLIEDAAESLGSLYRGRHTGTFGKFGVCSFNGNKIITTSGGGALFSQDSEMVNRAKFLASQARDPAPYYLHSTIGYNYRLSNICAGIGRGQLEILDSRVQTKRAIYERYVSSLSSYEALTFPTSIAGNFENRWLTTVLLNAKTVKQIPLLDVVRKLNELNAECRPLWNPMHLQPVFKTCEYFGTEYEVELFGRGLCLPSATIMTPEQQDFVMSALIEVAELAR